MKLKLLCYNLESNKFGGIILTSIQALILGLVQGLTEFLPVSSSGHLVIFQHLLGINEGPLTFDVLVHMGTLVAVFAAFWKDIIAICRKPFSKLTYLIIVASVPAAFIGYYLAPVFERAFESLLVVGMGLIFTGCVLRVSESLSKRKLNLKSSDEMTYADAVFIGCLQALAIIPGISRSGSTIAAGLLSGLERDFAARFSFLMSIPVILGAGVFKLKNVFLNGFPQSEVIPYIIGPVTAAVFGFIAIKLVLKLVRQGRLAVFSYYCWGVGIFSLLSFYIF